ncbi:50S ribosomal protein L3 [Candidatus Parcubacteria bacterium]|nr:50S ribosomal protein L3 [Candidatus Parcubacteria bacterium]
MKAILGTKIKMTQFFDEDGMVHPATIVLAGPCVVTQVKNQETDGYTAIQVGYGDQKESRKTKAELGHTKDLGSFANLSEFRIDDSASFNRGDKIEASIFEVGDNVAISGTSKGKGFQGVVKRHNFAGGRRSHGQKHSEREPGSIGATGAQRVFKGTKMGGRMGSDRITVKNLTVLAISPETNEILIKGAIPGRRGSVIEIRG